jgi:hypothetical protein
MAHAYTTVLNVAKLGANIELSREAKQAASTLLEVARIVAQSGCHATIDVTGHAAAAVRSVVCVERLQLGDWRSYSMILKYARLAPDHLARAAEKVAGKGHTKKRTARKR